MRDFIYHNPTKIYFGKNQFQNLPNEIDKTCRILFTYGQGSIKRNGVYEQIRNALQGYQIFEFGGIEPNPDMATLMPAVEIIKKEKIDFLLAAGGGSVLDGTKFIAAATNFVGDPWDFVSQKVEIKSALPFATVLTLPAAGSEMNCGLVISRRATRDKLGFDSKLLYPKFSILDPSTTFTLSADQTVTGIADIFAHVLEQYLTYPVNSPLQDLFSESILLTLIEEAPKVLKNPYDYDVRANLMWCGTMALNDIIAVGVPQDWAAHMLAMEITACFGIDHGKSLAVIIPAVMDVLRDRKIDKLLQYAARIFGITEGDKQSRIETAIAKTRQFFSSLGLKLFLNEYGIGEDSIEVFVSQLQRHGYTELGENKDVYLSDCKNIYFKSFALC